MTTKTPKLTAERVRDTLTYCLFNMDEIVDGDPPEDAIMVDGIVNPFALHPGRALEKRGEIAEMLSQLEDGFFAGRGGGMSFLRACYTRDEEHWGEHRDMDALFVLGLAVGLVTHALPREMWSALPGGMPYFIIDIKPQEPTP
jgi:hypothetical protein